MPKRLRTDRDMKRKVFESSSKVSPDTKVNNNNVNEQNNKSPETKGTDNPAVLKSEKRRTVFPKRASLYVFAATLLVRINYVSQKRNWWILHADEVYQIVEVAHSEVYGYGFRPYEYLPPPSGNFSSNSAQTEAYLGMYGLRSFILPKLFMLAFTIAEFVGIKDQPFLVAKLFHVLVSSCLPLAVHKLAKLVYKSESVAVMAAIFSAASLHLNLFGTHVLVNSFLAPLVFWCLANILQIIFETGNTNSGGEAVPGSELIGCATSFNSASINQNKKVASNININNTRKSNLRNHNLKGNLDILRNGFLLGICAYIRTDLLLFIGVFLLPFALRELRLSFEYFWTLVKLAVCFLSGMAFAGMDDWISYGQWGLSIYQWIRFNITTNLAAVFFGTSSGTMYLDDIFMCNWACLVVTVFSVLCLALQATLTSESGKDDFKMNIILLLECFVLLTVYSLQPHKEIRFLHNVIVVLCIVQSNVVFSFADYYCRVSCSDENNRQRVLYVIAVTYVLISWFYFPYGENGSFSRWTFTHNRRAYDVNVCMSYISSQDDVRGVFNGQLMQESGGFSLLHKNVTFLSLVFQEVCEYSPESRVTMMSLNPFVLGSYNISVNLANKFSDYITFDNMGYVHKLLIEDMRYNYAIIPEDTDFSFLGYEDVFKATYNKVVKRSKTAKSLKYAREFISNLQVKANATVLEYEGGRLVHFGLPLKAVPRLKQAIELDSARVRPYQLLMKAYSNLRDKDSYTKVKQQCVSAHSHELCLTPQPTALLNAVYGQPNKE